jgi:hypothetical protein
MAKIKLSSRTMWTIQYMLCISIVVLGIYHVIKRTNPYMEPFSTSNDCPNILLQKGARIYLYNSNKASVPGVNPLQFENLEEYTEFIDWQRANGMRCPVLFMSESYDAQGKRVAKVRGDPTNVHGGEQPIVPTSQMMDASRDSEHYNKNSYPGFDPDNQYIGKTVPIDEMEQESGEISGNPMDSNWGGNQYTNQLIDSGTYDGNTRKI